MKRPQTKVHAHTMREFQVIRLKKSNFIIRSKFIVRSTFYLHNIFFLFIDTLLKPQQQILICFCKF